MPQDTSSHVGHFRLHGIDVCQSRSAKWPEFLLRYPPHERWSSHATSRYARRSLESSPGFREFDATPHGITHTETAARPGRFGQVRLVKESTLSDRFNWVALLWDLMLPLVAVQLPWHNLATNGIQDIMLVS